MGWDSKYQKVISIRTLRVDAKQNGTFHRSCKNMRKWGAYPIVEIRQMLGLPWPWVKCTTHFFLASKPSNSGWWYGMRRFSCFVSQFFAWTIRREQNANRTTFSVYETPVEASADRSKTTSWDRSWLWHLCSAQETTEKNRRYTRSVFSLRSQFFSNWPKTFTIIYPRVNVNIDVENPWKPMVSLGKTIYT